MNPVEYQGPYTITQVYSSNNPTIRLLSDKVLLHGLRLTLGQSFELLGDYHFRIVFILFMDIV